jgi:hypothetical protein
VFDKYGINYQIGLLAGVGGMVALLRELAMGSVLPTYSEVSAWAPAGVSTPYCLQNG